jgi:hypothetical protein
MWGAASAIRDAIGSSLPPNERKKYDLQVAATREVMGGDAFAAAWEEGRAMTMEQAIAYALEEVHSRNR